MKLFYGTKPRLTQKDREMFSRNGNECKALFKTSTGEPVIISKAKDANYPAWRVEYGFSCIVFNSYDEALSFCKKRYQEAV